MMFVNMKHDIVMVCSRTISGESAGLRTKPHHWVCKLAYLVSVPSQDKLGRLCQEGHLA